MIGPELAASGLVKSYPRAEQPLTVLRGVSLALHGGESAAVMGDSGSGKSTLLHILGTLDRPDAGELRINGTDPFALNERRLAAFRNRTLGFVFQDHHLLPQCTALENVLLPALAERIPAPAARELRERAAMLLERVGVARRGQHFPAELSGGERQRIAVARALLHRPALLLADEPTGNLDEESGDAIAELLSAAARDEGAITVVVTHSPRIAARFDRVLALRHGQLSPRDRSL